jgi:hypothetical protein
MSWKEIGDTFNWHFKGKLIKRLFREVRQSLGEPTWNGKVPKDQLTGHHAHLQAWKRQREKNSANKVMSGLVISGGKRALWESVHRDQRGVGRNTRQTFSNSLVLSSAAKPPIDWTLVESRHCPQYRRKEKGTGWRITSSIELSKQFYFWCFDGLLKTVLEVMWI